MCTASILPVYCQPADCCPGALGLVCYAQRYEVRVDAKAIEGVHNTGTMQAMRQCIDGVRRTSVVLPVNAPGMRLWVRWMC